MGLKDPEYYINILISKSGNDIFFVIIIVKYYSFKHYTFKGTEYSSNDFITYSSPDVCFFNPIELNKLKIYV